MTIVGDELKEEVTNSDGGEKPAEGKVAQKDSEESSEGGDSTEGDRSPESLANSLYDKDDESGSTEDEGEGDQEDESEESDEDESSEGGDGDQDDDESESGDNGSEDESEEDSEEEADDKDADSKEFSKGDLKVPKDSRLSPEQIDGIVSKAKEQGLSKKEAQARLELVSEADAGGYERGAKDFEANARATVDKNAEKWEEQIRDDEKLGGARYEQTVETAREVAKTYFSPTIRRALFDSGWGSHPDLVKALVRISKDTKMAPRELPKGGHNPSQKKSPAEKLYNQS